MSETWEELVSCENEASAEAFAEALRSEGVPVSVEVRSPIPGLVESVRVVVPKNLVYRARRLLRSSKLSDGELVHAATGKLPPIDKDGA